VCGRNCAACERRVAARLRVSQGEHQHEEDEGYLSQVHHSKFKMFSAPYTEAKMA
jgi:hypothetical protein